ncbi:MAG: GTP 3',8-cyclase MoaA [Desulfobacterales bacterium]|nr:GTP 3',8-cyclase MoaA [Desulfobacterales bacterium]
MKLVDSFGRKIDYLRISITDQCNLKCYYCTPFSGRSHLSRSEILTYEEMLIAAKAAVRSGITKIRITGGEPLVRKGVVEFCRMLSDLDGLESLALTTNGIYLEEMAESLFTADVRRINISLDTLRPERFEKITGYNWLPRVLAGIKRAEQIGMHPIKINTVVMRGINDDEIEDLARLTLDKPYHVRFIELMPTDSSAYGNYEFLFMPVEEFMKKIHKIDQVQIEPAEDSYGPAKLCKLPGAKGKVGFIAPISWHFCGSCNRLRLTADGKIKTCLFSKEEIDIKAPLRSEATPNIIIKTIRRAVSEKPRRHYLNEKKHQFACQQAMRAIGG